MALSGTQRTNTSGIAAAPQAPLCVDLDGTLLRSDVLCECVAKTLWHPFGLLQILSNLARGRAFLKRRLADKVQLDVSRLPYDPDVLKLIERERASGRYIVLVTGSDETIANEIARHLKLFDEVIASDGSTNLTGQKKSDELIRRFGEQGFTYAGNDAADMAVWKQSKSAVLVGAPARLQSRAAEVTTVEANLSGGRRGLRSLVRLLRPYQWSKNLLVFVPLLTADDMLSASNWTRAAGLFVAFCIMASALYVLNDITDLDADRTHPRKRLRPLAAGEVDLRIAFALVPAGITLALILAAATGSFKLVLVYGVASISYSTFAKQFPLVDIFLLAGIYALRIFAGGIATHHLVSAWLLTFSAFVFFSLAAVKRTTELMASESEGSRNSRRGYLRADSVALGMMGIASSFVSCLVLAFYVQSSVVRRNYACPDLLWGFNALILFWQCRLWLSTLRGRMQDDPILFTVKDPVSWLIGCAGILIVLLSHSSTLQGVSFFYQQ